MSHITTHVLDTASGRPAVGVSVALFDADGSAIATGSTGADGRIPTLGPDALPAGHYRMVFDTGAWFGDVPHFFPVVTIDFSLSEAAHYHVPLLLSPFGYSTYRGS